mmetsp:Transcript_115/g.215  ORF Transcript_115/g.215 Transcript_115/m.215 type:complete len:272 (-) Transcript_115:163-978(-)
MATDGRPGGPASLGLLLLALLALLQLRLQLFHAQTRQVLLPCPLLLLLLLRTLHGSTQCLRKRALALLLLLSCCCWCCWLLLVLVPSRLRRRPPHLLQVLFAGLLILLRVGSRRSGGALDGALELVQANLVLQRRLELLGNFLQLLNRRLKSPQRLAQSLGRIRKPLWSEDEQGDDADDENLRRADSQNRRGRSDAEPAPAAALPSPRQPRPPKPEPPRAATAAVVHAGLRHARLPGGRRGSDAEAALPRPAARARHGPRPGARLAEQGAR